METAVLQNQSGHGEMINLKFLSYLINPKIWGAILILDISGIFSFITKYVFADITYLKFLIIACILDLITGITKVVVVDGLHAISSKGLRNTVTKFISYGSFLIIVHVLTHFEVDGKITATFTWVNKAALEFLILIEIKSVFENIVKINPKLNFIDSLLQKIGKGLKK